MQVGIIVARVIALGLWLKFSTTGNMAMPPFSARLMRHFVGNSGITLRKANITNLKLYVPRMAPVRGEARLEKLEKMFPAIFKRP
jgi:hypothetical protein